MKESTASISVGFNYEGTSKALKKTIDDARFYHGQFGSAVSSSPKFISDSEIKGRGKEGFLAMLRKQVAGKQYVSFNYAGHGLRYTKGRWAMLLPGMPQNKIDQCEKFFEQISYGLTTGKDGKKCNAIYDQYTVTDEDLRKVFSGKKVLFVNDSCHAGRANFGPSAVHIPSALDDQLAMDQLTSASQNGAMTERIRAQFNECTWDANKDGALDAQELTARYVVTRPGQLTTEVKGKSRRKAVSVYSQVSQTASNVKINTHSTENLVGEVPSHLIPGTTGSGTNIHLDQLMSVQNSKSWLKCFNLGASRCSKPSAVPASSTPQSPETLQ